MDAELSVHIFSEIMQLQMVGIRPSSNSKITMMMCQSGYWEGAADDDPNKNFFLYDIKGYPVMKGAQVRLYGTFEASTSGGSFSLEEVVEHL